MSGALWSQGLHIVGLFQLGLFQSFTILSKEPKDKTLMEKSPSLDESPFRPMGSQVLGRDWDAAVIQLVQ